MLAERHDVLGVDLSRRHARSTASPRSSVTGTGTPDLIETWLGVEMFLGGLAREA
ncbi:hypothetical protein [Lentzea sp. HUAS12]|uniref:hypothetical protein n=1 Tax=Lentzea sp. HUAS12 TaxID=2951806 RepID=UPI0020A1BF2F|nr:hypothetical protein [Lentzea sp. HUAS12]USX51735.1 hypothetical protein ND450_41450 [Lentzea sp. HUAS12]